MIRTLVAAKKIILRRAPAARQPNGSGCLLQRYTSNERLPINLPTSLARSRSQSARRADAIRSSDNRLPTLLRNLRSTLGRCIGRPGEGRNVVDLPDDASPVIKMRMGATHFLMKRPPRVATEMAHVLAYNLTRVTNIVGVQPLIAAMRT